jgi:putative ABC transport system permease protein
MNAGTLAVRNLTRNKLRVSLTILAAAGAITMFLLLRTVVWAWTYATEAAAKDRVATRHKVSFILPLPKHYIDKVRTVPGVKHATWMNWFGGKDPKDDSNFFANFAVDHHSFLDVYTELVLSPDARERWKTDPQAALVGDVLAKKMNLKEGDKLVLKGTIFPGDWEFRVAGIYQVTAKSWDRSSVVFHWEYMNNAIPERRREEIGWMVARIDDPAQSATISKAIDTLFEDQDIQTLSMSEKALNNSFTAMFEAILDALNVVSFVLMLIMALILGNTIAMGVRERTYEYGVMRAIGFLPKQIAALVVGEGLFIGLIGGLIGTLFGSMLIGGATQFVEEGPMAGFFPYFRLQPSAVILGLAFAIALGVVASLIPAYRASRLQVTDALRRVG